MNKKMKMKAARRTKSRRNNRISVYFDADSHRALRERAIAAGRSMSGYLRFLMLIDTGAVDARDLYPPKVLA